MITMAGNGWDYACDGASEGGINMRGREAGEEGDTSTDKYKMTMLGMGLRLMRGREKDTSTDNSSRLSDSKQRGSGCFGSHGRRSQQRQGIHTLRCRRRKFYARRRSWWIHFLLSKVALTALEATAVDHSRHKAAFTRG